MKKFLKWTGVIIGSLLTLVVVFAAFSWFASQNKLTRIHKVAVSTISIPRSPDAVAQGRHIARSRGCIDCHGEDLAGATIINDPAMGLLSGPNITPAGLGKDYSDEDWIRALRHGVSRDGRALVLMPSHEYAALSDEDLGAVIAYGKTLAPVARPSVPLKIGPVARALIATGKLQLAADLIAQQPVTPFVVKPGVTAEYGRYLAIGCIGCHNPSYSGGKIDAGPPDWPQAANLTSHEQGALHGWTEADFIAALRTARRPNGSEISAVMPRAFGNMNDTELKALWLFFQKVPPRAKGER